MASEIGARAVQADVSEAEDAKRLVEEAGDVDILVNNAGVTRDGLLARMPDEDWRVVLDTNLGGTFNTCRAAARGMMRRRSSAIVNVSSIVGLHGNPGQTNYSSRPRSSASRRHSRGARQARCAGERRRAGVHHDPAHDRAAEGLQNAMLANTPLGALQRSRMWPARAVPPARMQPRSSPARCSWSTVDWGCRCR